MSNITFGTVKFFNPAPDKRFGFIVEDETNEDVHFHLNNGKQVVEGEKEPEFNYNQRLLTEPKKSDRIAFIKVSGERGPKATVWTFESYYNAIHQSIATRPKPLLYRVQHTYSDPGKSGTPTIDWGGEKGRSLKELCERYPRDKHDDLRPFSDSDNIFDSRYVIEVNDGSGWQAVEEDPRPVISGFVKRKMW